MAVPADVIGGETITVEWGNQIRDWATSSVEAGRGAVATVDSTLTATFKTGATVTFTKPADWVTYKIMVWGSLSAGSGATWAAEGRIQIGSNNGTAMPGAGAALTDSPISANHELTGLTANTTVSIQYRETTGDVAVRHSTIQYIAIRTT